MMNPGTWKGCIKVIRQTVLAKVQTDNQYHWWSVSAHIWSNELSDNRQPLSTESPSHNIMTSVRNTVKSSQTSLTALFIKVKGICTFSSVQLLSPVQLFVNPWGGQNIGISASAWVLPKNTQDWSLEWTGWISLQSQGISRVFSNITVQKHQFFGAQPFSQSNSHIHTWPLEKP